MKEKEIKAAVRDRYGKIAKSGCSCCGPSSCDKSELGKKIGYSEGDMKSVPEGANLGLGCGNPVALASLKEGETVLDLGSGAGFDCFLAAKKVGKKGKVIGLDMTPEMVGKAKANAKEWGYNNVEFRLGEIEDLPLSDDSVDVVISNCVINLSPEKRKVFAEVYRVLRPGGRFMVSDIVLTRPLPAELKESVGAYVGCIAGAVSKSEYLAAINAAGFKDVRITDETDFPLDHAEDFPGVAETLDGLGMSFEEVKKAAGSIASIKVCGEKPKGKHI
jgi:arsenite methyltransferase